MIMIGISTGQNSTNLIPAVQLKIEKFIIVESTEAKSKNWSEGLVSILKARGIEVETFELEKGKDTNITEIYEALLQKAKTIEEPIIWNSGGGQKIHFAAIWDCFNERKGSDILCYTNPNATTIEKWAYLKNKKERTIEEINVDLTADEIFIMYGFSKKSGEIIYSKDKAVEQTSGILNLMAFKNFRQYLYQLPASLPIQEPFNLITLSDKLNEHKDTLKREIKSKLIKFSGNEQHRDFDELSGQINNFYTEFYGRVFKALRGENTPIEITEEALSKEISHLLENPEEIPIDKSLLSKIHHSVTGAPKYFELIVAQKIKNLIENTDNFIKYIYLNYETLKNNQSAAEYDVLLVTQFGTLLAFDAKTYDFTKKDEDARILNLERGGGNYVKFIVILPYFLNDMDIMPQRLKELPFELKKRDMPFFIVSDKTESFHLMRGSENNFLEVDSSVDKTKSASDTVEFIPIEKLLDTLKLIKQKNTGR